MIQSLYIVVQSSTTSVHAVNKSYLHEVYVYNSHSFMVILQAVVMVLYWTALLISYPVMYGRKTTTMSAA